MSNDLQTLPAPTSPNPAPQTTAIQKTPDPDDNLSPDQHNILNLLSEGHNFASAARMYGISRTTIYNWLNSDVQFRTRHNQWLDSVRKSCSSHLTNIAQQATETVESAIRHGDAKIAAQILKGMGMLSGKPADVICQPEQLQRDDLVKKLEQEVDLLQRELKALRRKAELFGLGTAPLFGCDQPVDPNNIPDPDEESLEQEFNKLCASEDLLLP